VKLKVLIAVQETAKKQRKKRGETDLQGQTAAEEEKGVKRYGKKD